ncbi:OmpA family protein [Mesorhizobium sp. M2C.T.Ca.TU.002.02.1.1]|uniref:OmpA family protein n=1 Tax=Mesorhizobium sp. M2C.T.Ca.TU.002.02.1.1 TaxID=2496788 RepID=UPI000FCCC794|nr:OmpA family protein [Mesorhizobium sp. M2C.T.Ca.TU.002.02.1.1]RUU56611.1 flagellar motor protein MotB [Mesorhizobium sp. M2C.T.Ca.TU.002.02.1.1]RUU68952.1 flagellar motor protein MotB [Mesorhizobium sp. M2C.T.Ca.TU.009.01.2.1]
MKRQPRILAGTAIGLLMASAPLGAYPLQGGVASGSLHGAPLVLAQAACAEGQSAEECAQGGAEQPRKRKREQQQQSESAPATEQAAPAESEQKPRRKRQEQQQMDNGQSGEAAPAEQQFKPRKKRDQLQQTEAAPADQGGQPATDEQQPRKKKRNQQKEAAPAEQPAEQAAPAATDQLQGDQQGNQGRKKRKRDQQQGEPAGQAGEQVAPAEQTAPANDNQQGGNQLRKKHKQNQQGETAPAEQTQTNEPAKKPAPAGEPVPQAEPLQNGEQPVQGEQAQDKKKRGKKPAAEQPANGEQPATGEQTKTGQPATGEQQPVTGNQPANNNEPANGGNAAQGETANPNEAPVLDSQKDAFRKRRGGQNGGAQTGGAQTGGAQTENGQAGNGRNANQAGQQGGQQAQQPAPVDQGPPPTDDKTAQQAIQPEKIAPVTEEKGKRVDLTPQDVVRERRRPQGADVVKQLGDRVILQFNNQTFVESNEAPRITRGARDVYYEDLSGGRTREIVERDNGVRIVTIRNRNGDVVRRSRITPDGREYVLSYVDERYYNDVDEWRDPGDDLPPMRLDMPRRDYILDSEDVESDDDYYTFLEQPPVERVQRLYSIDEVKRSARVRDIARRIDLDTLNFDFGSATISDAEVQKLDGVASAMEKLLKKNPAETFLIEGHTDAVGTPDANLALSDRRAEAVAEALTNAFGIPAENLTTQGYGEEYLKVNTPGPNRENRRVAIRRITSLVAPVASNSDQQ